MAPPIYVIAGPTGVGKTDVAIRLAETLGTDILSADSRQVYRGLDIGTAKPSVAQRERVSHRWIDELDVGEPTSAGIFSRVADAHIEQRLQEGRPVVIAGGSTLYIDSVVRGLSDLPGVDAAVLREVEQIAGSHEGREVLFAELLREDPVAAATLDATKSQRLVRLVSLLRSTGRLPSALWAEHRPEPHAVTLVVLDRPRETLYARINARVDSMLAEGLVDENRRLLAAGHSRGTPGLNTIGYKEPMLFLDEEISEDEMVRQLKQNTRRYAKRQLTWLRRYPSAHWLSATSIFGADTIENIKLLQ